MRPGEVVVHEVERHRRVQVLDPLRERVGQPREAAHPHPHRQVLALDIARGDTAGVRLALHFPNLDASACGGAVASFIGAWVLALFLDDLGVVNVRAACSGERGASSAWTPSWHGERHGLARNNSN